MPDELKPKRHWRGGRKPLQADERTIRVTLHLRPYEIMELIHNGELPTRTQEILLNALEKHEDATRERNEAKG